MVFRRLFWGFALEGFFWQKHFGRKKKGSLNIQGALNPVFLTPFSKAKFYALGMRCFAALFRKIWLPPARWMFAWWLRSAKSPHLTRVNSRIHIMLSLCARLCWHCKWQKTVGWAQCVKPWQRDRNCPGMRKAQGSALHRHRARRCTIRGLGAAQVTSYPQNKGFCWNWALRGDRPRRCAGNARGVARPMPCNACIEKRPNPLCLLLVISSTFFATRGRRDSWSLARFDCADSPNHDRRWKK